MINLTQNIDGIRSLSQLLTPAVFKRIIKDDLKIYNNLIKKHIQSSFQVSNSELINHLYASLNTNYKNEYVYKNILLNELLLKKYSLSNSTMLNEFKIGDSIADFILLNGEARVYEIKTELDSLAKLKKQLNDYLKFANKVYIVANSKFIEKIKLEYTNDLFGIIELTAQNELIEVREAKVNHEFLDHITLFKTLRKKEYIEIINHFFGFTPDVPNTQIFKECLSLAMKIDVVEFQKLVFNKLKERNLKCPDLLTSSSTPYELKHICYTMNLSSNDYNSLHNFLSNKTNLCTFPS